MKHWRSTEAALCLLAVGLGWAWLALGARAGVWGSLMSFVPGIALLVGGASHVHSPGAPSNLQFAVAGAVAGAFTCPIAAFAIGPVASSLLFAANSGLLIAIGVRSVRRQRNPEGVPRARLGPGCVTGTLADQALLAWLKVRLQYPIGPERIDRLAERLRRASEIADQEGWSEDPASYLRAPDAPTHFELRARSVCGIAFEHLRFASEFSLRKHEPADSAFRAHQSRDVVHAWILRHRGPPRPWLIGIHGYRLGTPLQDFVQFPPSLFHRSLGLNVALCVLPLHGPRRWGWLSGDGFLDEDPLQTLYAEAQANWDLRRLVAWIENQGASGIGCMGISLGAYSASLLATTCDRMRFAIMGMPPSDLSRIFVGHGPDSVLRRLEAAGVDQALLERLFRPISPLNIAPSTAPQRRLIYAGVADQVVPPEHANRLALHWDDARVVWYQGGHLRMVRNFANEIRDTIEGARLG